MTDTKSPRGELPLGGKKRRTALTVTVIVVVVVVIAAVVVVAVEYHPPKTTPTTVEFYTWWATEGKVALNHLGPAFHTAYPQYTLSPYISPGAGGSNAKYAILALLEAGVPPASFQTHFGPEMLSYVEAATNHSKAFVNMTGVASSEGITANSFPSVLEAGTFNGTEFSLPANLHQGAQLYFNPKILSANNLPIPTNVQTLINDTKALASKGITAWVIPGGDGGWDQLNLWENLFLANTNNIMYDELMYGTLNTSNPSVMSAINATNQEFMFFYNNSYSGEQSLSWTQAIPLVTSGKAVFQTNGNWYTNYAYDFLNTTNYPAISPYTSWTNISLMSNDFPGTGQYYAAVIDSVAVPTGPTEPAGLTFAKYFASYPGQLVWTKWKAVTFYDNITTDYYNTPAQWYSYQLAKSTPASKWVYQLSDGGVFDDVAATLTLGMTSLSSTGYTGFSAWYHTLGGAIATEKTEWQTANEMGFGYMGSPGHPFGGYLPPWANTTANRTAAAPQPPFAATHANSAGSHVYVVQINLILFSENFILQPGAYKQ